MHGQPERIEQFKQDVAELRISDPSTSRDRLAARGGIVAMVAGVGIAVAAYAMSHSTDDALQQRDAIVVALLGVAVTAAGAGLYVKAAIAGFLRFWLLRDLHERRAQTDRVVRALEQGTQRHDLPSSES